MAFVSTTPVLSRRPFVGNTIADTITPVTPIHRIPHRSSSATRMAAAGAEDSYSIDMAKRNTLNLMLAGATGAVALGVLGPFAFFFVPPKAGNLGEGLVAKDALGKDLKKTEYLSSHYPGSRELVQGLKGDATWLIVTKDRDLEYYALNAVCTHLGCVVPWNRAENKYQCPCHGSQYSPTGAVTRGPAPLPLALERVESDDDDNIVLKSWKETDFRTGGDPWWKF